MWTEPLCRITICHGGLESGLWRGPGGHAFTHLEDAFIPCRKKKHIIGKASDNQVHCSSSITITALSPWSNQLSSWYQSSIPCFTWTERGGGFEEQGDKLTLGMGTALVAVLSYVMLHEGAGPDPSLLLSIPRFQPPCRLSLFLSLSACLPSFSAACPGVMPIQGEVK